MSKFCDFEHAAVLLRSKLKNDFIVLQDVYELIKNQRLELMVFFPKPIILLKCCEYGDSEDPYVKRTPDIFLSDKRRGVSAIYQNQNELHLLLFVDDLESKTYYLLCDILDNAASPQKIEAYGGYVIKAPCSDFVREFGFRLHEITIGEHHKYHIGDPFVLKNDNGVFMLEKPYKGLPSFCQWGVSVDSLSEYIKKVQAQKYKQISKVANDVQHQGKEYLYLAIKPLWQEYEEKIKQGTEKRNDQKFAREILNASLNKGKNDSKIITSVRTITDKLNEWRAEKS